MKNFHRTGRAFLQEICLCGIAFISIIALKVISKEVM